MKIQQIEKMLLDMGFEQKVICSTRLSRIDYSIFNKDCVEINILGVDDNYSLVVGKQGVVVCAFNHPDPLPNIPKLSAIEDFIYFI